MGIIARWTAKRTAARKRKAAALAHIKQDRAVAKRAEKDAAYARRVIERHSLSPRSKAVRWAAAQIGTTEHPAGSNSGPKITAWLKMVNCSPAPWCGAFVHAALKQAGVKGLSWRMRYTPWIVEDAKARKNGLDGLVPWAKAAPGDLVLFDWHGGGVDHVGIIEKVLSNSLVTIEGNTSSSDAGSQSNGGGVFRRERQRPTVAYIARPRWP